jgi:hypothetical protein
MDIPSSIIITNFILVKSYNEKDKSAIHGQNTTQIGNNVRICMFPEIKIK